MSILKLLKKDKIYRNLFLFTTISIVLTIIILSGIIFFNFQNIMLYQIFNSEKNSLSQVIYSAKTMTDYSTTFAHQLFSDNNITHALYSTSLEDIDINELINKLAAYENSTPFIDSIYIYNGKMDKVFIGSMNYILYPFYDADSFYDQDIIRILKEYDNFGEVNPIPRKYELPSYSTYDSVEANVYSFVFKGYPVKGSAIVLNIAREWMEDALQALDNNSNGKTIAVDKNGYVVADSSSQIFLVDLSQMNFLAKIYEENSNSNFFVDEFNGIKSLIIYVKYDWLNWIFIRAIPYNNLVSRIEDMKKNILIISLSILIVGFIISCVMSKKLYKPIDHLLVKLKSLEDERARRLFSLKQDFLKSIVFGTEGMAYLDNLPVQFGKYNVGLDPEKKLIMILFTIDNKLEFCNNYNFKDRSLLKYSIMNVGSEIIASRYKNEFVDMGDEKIIALINIDNNDSNCRNELNQIISNIQSYIRQHMQLSLSATVNTNARFIEHIRQLYEETVDFSNYKLFYGHRCILYAEDINKQKSSDYNYPIKKVKALIESVKLGRKDEMFDHYMNIIQEAACFSYTTFHMVINRLAFDINTAVDIIEMDSKVDLGCDFNSFIIRLNNQETIEDINNMFFKLLEHIINELQKIKNPKHDDLIKNVIKIINESYQDQNLCLESIADKVAISPAYLGRLFKKTMTVSFSDHINKVRMAKAREYLLSTTDSIDVIAEKTGYTNSQYFYRIFKKYHGITPNEYRMRRQGNATS